jgi:hypothetical protein
MLCIRHAVLRHAVYPACCATPCCVSCMLCYAMLCIRHAVLRHAVHSACGATDVPWCAVRRVLAYATPVCRLWRALLCKSRHVAPCLVGLAHWPCCTTAMLHHSCGSVWCCLIRGAGMLSLGCINSCAPHHNLQIRTAFGLRWVLQTSETSRGLQRNPLFRLAFCCRRQHTSAIDVS